MVIAAHMAIEAPQKVVEWNFLAAAKRLELEPELVARLQMAWREVAVSVPVRRHTGEVLIVECIRVLHSNARGPAIGGMLTHRPADQSIIGAMAFSNTLAATVAGVPFGGSFGAFCCDLDELTRDEREQLALGYASRIEPTLGAYRDVYAKSGDSHVLNMMLNSGTVDSTFSEVCGKPIGRGGLLDPKLAENGLSGLIWRLMPELDDDDVAAAVVFGEPQRARAIARVLSSAKMKVTFSTERRSRDELLAAECDVLVYCGESCSFTPARALQVGARLVVEASPMAITPDVESALQSRSIKVAPDLLVRAPEFIAAYLEWSQNMEGKQHSKLRLHAAMSTRLEKACSRVLERAEQHALSLREAAYDIAVEQLARCEALRAAA